MERKYDLQTGKKAGLLYFFLVGIIVLGIMSIVGCSGGGDDGESITPLSPTAPTNVKATAGNDQITISWDNVSGATWHNIYWTRYPGVTKDSYEDTISDVTNPYVHRGLTNGTTYYYIVTAENSNGESDESSETSATPFTPYPDTVVDTISVDDTPIGIVISPNGDYVYVSNTDDSMVSVIRTSDNAMVKTIPVNDDPVDMVVTPDGSHVYVAHWDRNRVSVIQTSDNTVIDTILMSDNPEDNSPISITISPVGDYVYVAYWLENQRHGEVSKIQTSDNTVVNTISVDYYPIDITITPAGNYVYVTNVFDEIGDDIIVDGTVLAIRTSDLTVIDTISVGKFPTGIVVTPNGDYVYVAHFFDETVSVIQTSDNTVIDTIPRDKASYFLGIAITPNGKYIYVTDLDVINWEEDDTITGNTVSVIRTSDNRVIDTVSVGKFPIGIAISPNGECVYVGNIDDDTISVIGFSDQ